MCVVLHEPSPDRSSLRCAFRCSCTLLPLSTAMPFGIIMCRLSASNLHRAVCTVHALDPSGRCCNVECQQHVVFIFGSFYREGILDAIRICTRPLLVPRRLPLLWNHVLPLRSRRTAPGFLLHRPERTVLQMEELSWPLPSVPTRPLSVSSWAISGIAAPQQDACTLGRSFALCIGGREFRQSRVFEASNS